MELSLIHIFPLKGGGACALVSEYLPQWVSRDLAGLLPNPQNLMFVGATAGSALALALVARRASRVISRKMAPLAEAAERVGAGELDFAVGSTNVREVNDVLAAMDAMRASLCLLYTSIPSVGDFVRVSKRSRMSTTFRWVAGHGTGISTLDKSTGCLLYTSQMLVLRASDSRWQRG